MRTDDPGLPTALAMCAANEKRLDKSVAVGAELHLFF